MENIIINNNIWHNESFFIVGETHGIKENISIKLELLKYLIENNNVTKFILELGYYDSLGINEYLKTGNKTILYNVLMKYNDNYANSEYEMRFWEEFYEYIACLNKSIKVLGVDCNGNMNNIYKYIVFLLQQHSNNFAKESIIETLKNYKSAVKNKDVTYYYQIKSALIMQIDMLDDQEKLANLVFELIANGDKRIFPELRKEIREQYISECMIREIKKIEYEGKIFGQFGESHVSSTGFLSAISRAEKDTKRKYIKIILLYDDCDFYIIKNNVRIYKKINTLKVLKKDMGILDLGGNLKLIIDSEYLYYLIINP